MRIISEFVLFLGVLLAVLVLLDLATGDFGAEKQCASVTTPIVAQIVTF